VENSVNVVLSPWIIFTADENIPVNPDWVVTIVDPIEGLRKMYEEKVQ
jgi:Uma2 family endonuclease